MSDLQRFNTGGYGAMVEDEEGKWCRYEDVTEGFRNFGSVCEAFLENYPPDIFDASSGDKGPVFVAAIRAAVTALQDE